MNDQRLAQWVLPALIGLICLAVIGCAPSGIASPTPKWETVTPTPLPTFTAIPMPTGTLIPTATLTSTPEPTPTEAAKGPRPEPVEGLTITIIYDNNPYDERLETAWGFSCLVEGLEKTILFDTGGDSAMLLRNMRKLGVDPQDVEVIVISHVHGDHVGGLAGFLDENHAVTVYLPRSLPGGIKDASREAGAELVEVHGPVEICEHVYSTGELDWIEEQSLVIETSQGMVVITGCAHPGIVNIVRRAKELTGGEVYLVLGGFHLGGVSAAEIAGIVEDFQQLGVQKAAPCHCSGDAARRLFEEAYGEDFIPAGVGSRLEVRD